MPYGDGTGPMGAGPMTGRGMGRCAGGTRTYGRGRGFGYGYGGGYGHGYGGGRGRGFGRGYGRHLGFGWGAPVVDPWLGAGYPYDWSTEQEKDVLKRQADYFEAQARELRQRMSSLEQEVSDSAKDE